MKIIDNILWLEFADLVQSGVSENTLLDAKKRKANCWTFMDDPTDKRKVLISYDGLKATYQKMVFDRFGNPYDLVARMPILKMVELDHMAHDFYRKHRYLMGKTEKWLDVSIVNKYTRSASWLAMLNRVEENKKDLKKTLGLSLAEFYTHTTELIIIEKGRGKLKGYAGMEVLPGDFPSSFQRLRDKARIFKEKGYEYLIDPLYGNKNAAKIGKTAQLQSDVNTAMPQLMEGVTTSLPVINEGNLTPISVKSDLKSKNKRGAFDQELHNRQMAVIRAIAAKHQNFDAGQLAIRWLVLL